MTIPLYGKPTIKNLKRYGKAMRRLKTDCSTCKFWDKGYCNQWDDEMPITTQSECTAYEPKADATINLIVDGKNKKSFIKYLEKHPKERLWQCIRNWSKYNYILYSSHWDTKMHNNKFLAKNKVEIGDTFYLL